MDIGPTEATIYIASGEITQEDIKKDEIYIGKPLLGDNIEIRNKNGEILPIGCKGELYMSGFGISQGYINNKEKTQEVFYKEKGKAIYKSGDIGYYNSDGRITCLGRTDGQIKIRGFRVEIQEIEKAILSCENVTRTAVLAVNEKNYTKKLIGFIETKQKNYTKKVLESISKTLTPYMIPELFQLEEFPLTTSGKIDRVKLLGQVDELKDENIRKIIAPENPIEEELLKIVKRITRKRKVSIKDDFFRDLMMDSLDIMSFATDLSEYNITVQDINSKTNIKALSEVIESRNQEQKHFIEEKEDALEEVDVVNKSHVFDLSHVLITGATGFLGAHILKELLENAEVKQIFCLIRKKTNQTIKQRLEEVTNKYFNETDIYNLNKIVLVEGNFEKEDLGISKESFEQINGKVKSIIHAGANVKHFGNYSSSYKSNVEGTKNVIKFAQEISAAIAHISTLSVSGISSISEMKNLDENNLYINQMFFKNIYLTTKYQAEVEILKNINNNKIKAKIFRMGNIMPRISDGIFQANVNENAFLNKLRTCLKTQMIAISFANQLVDLTPVDLAVKSICLLLKDSKKQTIYNIVNDKRIKVQDITIYYDKTIKVTDVKTQIEAIQKTNDPRHAILLSNLQSLGYAESSTTSVITNKKLMKNNFIWERPNELYLKNLLMLAEF